MKTTKPFDARIWGAIAEYVQWLPSPHNTQPYRLKVIDETKAEVVFMPDRGLFVADPHGKFTWLTAGIFVEICTIAANSLGYELKNDFIIKPMYANGDHQTPQVICKLTLKASKEKINNLDAGLIRQRHTSRLPYDGRPVPQLVLDELEAEAKKYGHSIGHSNDAADIKWIVELNKDSLFYDLEDVGVRTELAGWLRFSKRHAAEKGDGLSAECMHLPGWLLKSFFHHPKFWLSPAVRPIVAGVYKSTMKGIGTIGWLRGSYVDTEDWINAGHLMYRLWLILTKHGLYWHPYGSIITNDKARQTVLNHLKIGDEDGGKQMVWLLLRMGYSAEPPHSKRLPLEDILL